MENMEDDKLTELIQGKIAAGNVDSGWALALVGMKMLPELKRIGDNLEKVRDAIAAPLKNDWDYGFGMQPSVSHQLTSHGSIGMQLYEIKRLLEKLGAIAVGKRQRASKAGNGHGRRR